MHRARRTSTMEFGFQEPAKPRTLTTRSTVDKRQTVPGTMRVLVPCTGTVLVHIDDRRLKFFA